MEDIDESYYSNSDDDEGGDDGSVDRGVQYEQVSSGEESNSDESDQDNLNAGM